MCPLSKSIISIILFLLLLCYFQYLLCKSYYFCVTFSTFCVKVATFVLPIYNLCIIKEYFLTHTMLNVTQCVLSLTIRRSVLKWCVVLTHLFWECSHSDTCVLSYRPIVLAIILASGQYLWKKSFFTIFRQYPVSLGLHIFFRHFYNVQWP